MATPNHTIIIIIIINTTGRVCVRWRVFCLRPLFVRRQFPCDFRYDTNFACFRKAFHFSAPISFQCWILNKIFRNISSCQLTLFSCTRSQPFINMNEWHNVNTSISSPNMPNAWWCFDDDNNKNNGVSIDGGRVRLEKGRCVCMCVSTHYYHETAFEEFENRSQLVIVWHFTFDRSILFRIFTNTQTHIRFGVSIDGEKYMYADECSLIYVRPPFAHFFVLLFFEGETKGATK